MLFRSCPIENLETKVFIQRTPPYIPEEHNGIVPTDYQYTAPIETCDEHDESTVIPIPLEDDNDFWFPWYPWDRDNNNGNNDNDNSNDNDNGNGNGNNNGNDNNGNGNEN